MFTGIVRGTTRVRAVEDRRSNRRVAFAVPRGWKLPVGGSVAVDGICSTVVQKRGSVAYVEYMPQTQRLTTAKHFSAGRVVNLELPLQIGGTLDGHLVQGHVDGVATIAVVVAHGDSREMTLRVPKPLLAFIAEKGSITINGVALTVARVRGNRCTVALIPYTLATTNLGMLTKGAEVNVEVDLIARYLAKLHG